MSLSYRIHARLPGLGSELTPVAKSDGAGSKGGEEGRLRHKKGCLHVPIRSLPYVAQNHADSANS